jgi:hypothetical protein
MNIKHQINKIFLKKPLVKVYSHPRSGTHFLEAFLAKNFYKDKDLAIDEITWGHWSNRKIKKEGNPYGMLFGNHYFADKNDNRSPKIYIYRDGRAVAYSIWKTPNFLNHEDSKLEFNEFLTENIDWYGSTSKKTKENYTIFEHWLNHVDSWKNLAETNENLLIIRYEDLIDNPYDIYKLIHSKFFSRKKLLLPEQIDCVKKPIGLLPNKGTKDAWKHFIDDYNNDIYAKKLLPKIKM